jgi:pimeloyl-ACP methyl ester carboxylesterase
VTTTSTRLRRSRWTVALLGAALAAAAVPGTASASPGHGQHGQWGQHADDGRLPIVFVHGNSGSAAQFETQFQRFASNGWDQDLLYAFEYDTSATGADAAAAANATAVANLEPFIDRVLAETGADSVLLAAHSRGTTVSHAYLGDAARAAEVAKYVNLDGRSADAQPGGVPTLAVWGEWNSPPTPRRGTVGVITGAQNSYNPDQGHTETASSPKTFDEMYEFFTGEEPATTDVVAERPNQVTVAGRAVLFPQNAGYANATLEMWKLDPDTGQRVGRGPQQSLVLGQDGAFGPFPVNGRHTYEFALTRPDGTVHHFYQSPFTRDDHFVRLNSSLPGASIEPYVATSSQQSNLSLIRAREIWGDQGANSDSITVDVLGDPVAPLQVSTPTTTPRTGPIDPATGRPTAVGETNALYLFDVGARIPTALYEPGDRVTDLSKGDLFPFNTLTFLNAADVFLPSSDGQGTIRVVHQPRGSDATQVLNVPAFDSTTDRVSITLRDAPQADQGHAGR